MKNGHYSGYKMKMVGEIIFYYCPRHPQVSWNNLDHYDLHYEIQHLKDLKKIQKE